ncbi:hypothetical protein [Rhodoligotrophos ferricapiens]|uniref:hypothetical protein n=1 Tax=Rhodoligotrophos ferricapiens TaxID=3069264 RepID=UPI00315DE1A0
MTDLAEIERLKQRLRAGYHPLSESDEFADDAALIDAADALAILLRRIAEMEAERTIANAVID